MLQSAKNLRDTAGAMLKLATALDRGDVNKDSLGKVNNALDHGEKLIKAAEAVGALRNLSLATDNLNERVSEASVNAWADSVGDAFDKAGGLIDLIPKGAIPGFVNDYYKGLFSAPKNFIAAFKALMGVHYGTIDKESGISRKDHQAEDLGKTGLDWEGGLSSLFAGGFALPKAKTGETFQRYMLSRRETEGVDLFTVTPYLGKAVLRAAIARDISVEDPAQNAWTSYVAGAK
jgi:hypothetical protein